jgi:hypothetical protein
MMKIKRVTTTAALLTTLFLAGCATTPSAQQAEKIKLEGVDSNSARISRLYLTPSEGETLLRGEVERRIHAHGQIPGHLHVELISPEGKVIKEADIGYARQNSDNHNGNFKLVLPEEIEAGSTLRVTHHDPVSHMTEPVESPWHDVNDAK